MKLCLTTSFFALAACGGASEARLPSETVVVLDPPDAQAVSPEADPPNTAEASSEAPSADPPDAAADAADVVPLGTRFDAGQPETDVADSTPEADVALDAGAACTPLSTTLYFPCAGSSMQANGLSQYCESTVGNPPTSNTASTPDVCRCRETYNCACILLRVTCAGNQAPSNCFDPLGTDPKTGDPTSAVRVICP